MADILPPRPAFISRPNSQRSGTPSLSGSSFKARKSFGLSLPSLLGGQRGMRTKGFNTEPQPTAKPVNEPSPVPRTPANMFPKENARNPARRKTEPVTFQNPRPQPAKSQTILRRITTKFRTRSPSPTTETTARRLSIRAPGVSAGLASKEAREAALRERGLLPPLAPNKDLSVQELEQDRRLAPIPNPTDSDAVTAAAKVKQEWVTKNKGKEVAQSERLNNFRFGGGSPEASPVISEFGEVVPSSNQLGVVIEVDTPLASPDESPLAMVKPISSAPKSMRYPRPPALNLADAKPKPPQYSPSPTRSAPLTPSHLEYITPYLFPLPPSPSVSALPSPTASSLPPASPSVSVGSAVSGTETPRPFKPAMACKGPLSAPGSPRSYSLPSHMESSTSEVSIATPSLLDSTTVSSISTSDSSAFGTYAARMNLKPGVEMNVSVMTNDVHVSNNIPVIVENPAEENDADVPIAVELAKEGKQVGLPGPEVTQEPTHRAPMKRKSMNIFRRNTQESLQNTNDNHQLNSKLSMGSIRRSMVGISRPKSGAFTENSKSPTSRTFDASHLPPSPLLSSSFADRQQASMALSGVQRGGTVARRTPVSPTMHSRGSILIEALTIEDEESRRMTEMAFCG